MTPEHKKMLTEWLGIKCNHDTIFEPDEWRNWKCKYCGAMFKDDQRPITFADPADFFAVFNRLVEKEEWDAATHYAYQIYDPNGNYLGDVKDARREWPQWFLSKNPDGTYRLCSLVAEWIAQQT